MNKTAIDWCDYSVNPVKGLCPVDCKDSRGKSYCYARGMYKRFKWNPEIVFDLKVLGEPSRMKKPSRIFWGSTMELFGPWIPKNYVEAIIASTLDTPQHTHIFLTKRPWELPKYNPWPDNCWVGASVTGSDMAYDAYVALQDVQAKVRFASAEPLLEELVHEDLLISVIDWMIIGQRTPVRKPIPREWVTQIVEAADAARIPVFLKDNLKPILELRQDWPDGFMWHPLTWREV